MPLKPFVAGRFQRLHDTLPIFRNFLGSEYENAL